MVVISIHILRWPWTFTYRAGTLPTPPVHVTVHPGIPSAWWEKASPWLAIESTILLISAERRAGPLWVGTDQWLGEEGATTQNKRFQHLGFGSWKQSLCVARTDEHSFISRYFSWTLHFLVRKLEGRRAFWHLFRERSREKYFCWINLHKGIHSVMEGRESTFQTFALQNWGSKQCDEAKEMIPN